MLLLFDIGNTNTHIGLADSRRVVDQVDIPTREWFEEAAAKKLRRFLRQRPVDASAICSVVPQTTPVVRQTVLQNWKCQSFQLTHRTVRGIGIDYPRPETIGEDRLANAVAAFRKFGAPSLVVDFGTAVTFDVVDSHGNYAGGIIAPGISAMTEYLHEKTALLPRIHIREIKAVIGRNTEEAMLIGAVHGYRGLVRELILELKRTLKVRRLPVVATGGYAGLIARQLPEITKVDPVITLEGLRLVWEANQKEQCRRGGEKPCYLTDADF